MSINHISDEVLVDGCLHNNRKMQEMLYRRFAGEMYAVCRAYATDTDEAKDILQDSFIKVFKNIGQYNGKGALKAWIRRIITNTAIDHIRRKPQKSDLFEVENIVDDRTAEVEMEKLTSADVFKQVQRLPEGARLIFNLYALEGLSHKEIAVKLNITESTSKSQFRRARQLLQVWIDRN